VADAPARVAGGRASSAPSIPHKSARKRLNFTPVHCAFIAPGPTADRRRRAPAIEAWTLAANGAPDHLKLQCKSKPKDGT
jgi:hypothetical protein